MTGKLNFSKNKSEVLSNDIDSGVYFSQRRKLPFVKRTLTDLTCFSLTPDKHFLSKLK